MTVRIAVALVALAGAQAVAAAPADLPPAQEIASPARAGSREPSLALTPDGRVAMSWLEPAGRRGMALRCALFDGTRWSASSTIATGDSLIVNWADFPSILAPGGDRLAAHWLVHAAGGPYASGIRIRQSEDGGRTWSAPLTPHRDGTATEHGFVSLAAASGDLAAVWLDGRKTEGHDEGAPGPTPDMTLRGARITRAGALLEEDEIDGRVCDCCQTAAAATDRGVLVAYRDRSPDEVRDIWVARHENGRWSPPHPVHGDGWRIEGCPVNGPALAAKGSRVAVAWYTAARDSPRVNVAFSDDFGDHFAAPARVDEGEPLGRVHLALLDDGSALVVWLEAGGGGAAIRVRRVTPRGEPGPARTVARTTAQRAGGFPRIVRQGRTVLLAWTEPGPRGRVRVARLALGGS